MRKRIGIWSRPMETEETEYLGNSATFIFHRPRCIYGLRTSRTNRLGFKTRFEAFWARSRTSLFTFWKAGFSGTIRKDMLKSWSSRTILPTWEALRERV